MKKTPILRATRSDWMATGIISAVCAVAVAGAYFTADIRDAELTRENLPPEGDVQVLAQVPNALTESFRLPAKQIPGNYRARVAKGLIISADDRKVTATQPDGTTAWTYSRKNDDICSLGTAWDRVVVTYRTGVGCGDTVSIDAATGQYADTRSANNSDDVITVSSNDRVGTLSDARLDLWRSDMVRTIEYGDVEAKQEPDMQPNEDCVLSSALTRTENVALTESCPDEPNSTWLRLMGATPKDSRKPEPTTNVAIQMDGARLVAIAQEAAAVYLPSNPPQLRTFDKAGKEIAAATVAESPAVMNAATPFAPATGDLPHHMTWFDGTRLYLLNPSTLAIQQTFEDAIGTGIAVDNRLLMPTQEGIAVVNWTTGDTERTIPVDRGGYDGAVYLSLAGTTIVEARGDEYVVLAAS